MSTTKKETIEEFLARGGRIQKFECVEPEEKNQPIRSNTTGGLPEIMTLSDGAHYFGETRKKKPTRKDFLKKLEKSNLPKEVIDSLTKNIKGK